MLLTKEVKISPRGKDIKKYRDKGYNFKYGDIISVKIEDISKESKTLVTYQCDYCGRIVENALYANYCRHKDYVQKDACSNCIQHKNRETALVKYGVDSVNKLKDLQKIKTSTYKSRYGKENPEGHKMVQEKINKTCQEKYGVDRPLQNDQFKQKAKNTCIDKYGFDNPMKNDNIKQKAVETSMQKYGCEYPMQNKDVVKNFKQSFECKYGVDNPMKVDRFADKMRKSMQITKGKNGTASCSSGQAHIAQLYGASLNELIGYYFVDMLFKEDNIYCEYDGGGHQLCVDLGQMSQDDFDKKQNDRYQKLKRDGLKMFRIINRSDRLPDDNILLLIKQFAFNLLKNTDINWITFDVDQYIIETKQYNFKWEDIYK